MSCITFFAGTKWYERRCGKKNNICIANLFCNDMTPTVHNQCIHSHTVVSLHLTIMAAALCRFCVKQPQWSDVKKQL